ncbi:hypothetical protein TRFO_08940 [Tritrichomonas foetus]|uniref:Myb-like DNA-binding domain containing protein n=1 Tax=Tritrichomonas foetus TaxID=1144522 RepID=A0A1J4JJ25_9EUKA|nr:hypothetical protein TRFO_08940 [Tritrichomonas foetus]|eukprot:OHS98351.1 hypothetical protein TRFO_08940 [Tritrichomonas foetus]
MNKTPWAINLNDDSISGAKEHLEKVSACRRRVFTTEEDKLLSELVTSKSCTNWFEIAKYLPGRSARQCRDRWVNYLSPENSFEPWTEAEDKLIVCKVNEIGTKWSAISKLIPGRSDNSVKNRWYSGLKNMCTRTIGGRYIYEPKSAIDKKNNKSDKNGKKQAIEAQPIPHSIINRSSQLQPLQQIPQLPQIPNNLPQMSQMPQLPQLPQLPQMNQMPGMTPMLPMFPMMSMAMNMNMFPQNVPNMYHQYNCQFQQMLAQNPPMPPQQQQPLQPPPAPACPVQSSAPSLPPKVEAQAAESTQYEDDDDFDDDIWDRQIENQLNELDQDPFTSVPSIFNEWF